MSNSNQSPLNVGDKVFYFLDGAPYSSYTVERVTKTTAILNGGTVLNRETLWERGNTRWNRTHYKRATPEIEAVFVASKKWSRIRVQAEGISQQIRKMRIGDAIGNMDEIARHLDALQELTKPKEYGTP